MMMTSPFDKAPNEVLECIAKHLYNGSEKDLRQLQLTSKRFQSIAEKQLFKTLVLTCHVDARYMMKYAQFLVKPERCKLVKFLFIDDKHFVALEDGFFDMFCRIEIVDFNHYDGVNWQYFSKMFTPERCKLKEIPYPPANQSDVEPYLKALQDHSQTLEKLDFTIVPDAIAFQFTERIARSRTLLELKSFSLVWTNHILQELDDVINKCPTLEKLNLFSYTKGYVSPWISTRQHQRHIKSVYFQSSSAEFTNMCIYLVTKFPNVRRWGVTNFDSYNLDKEDKVASFEKLVDIFHLMMKSKKVVLNILTTYSSSLRAFEFFKSHRLNTKVSIEYQPPHVSFSDISRYKNNSLDMCIIKLRYVCSQDPLGSMATIVYLSDGLDHLNLLKTIGRSIQTLKISLPLDEYTEHESMDIQRMLQGGALVHLLDNCPSLISVEYRADTLKYIDHARKINKCLKRMVLQCGTIYSNALSNLSCIAPGIVDLTIKSRFDELVNNNIKNIMIYMPKNNLDRVVLEDPWWYQNSTPCGDILVQITSLATFNTKYYIQKHYEDVEERFASVSDAQENGTYINPPHTTRIVIVCQSIKYMKYSIGSMGNLRCMFKVFI